MNKYNNQNKLDSMVVSTDIKNNIDSMDSFDYGYNRSIRELISTLEENDSIYDITPAEYIMANGNRNQEESLESVEIDYDMYYLNLEQDTSENKNQMMKTNEVSVNDVLLNDINTVKIDKENSNSDNATVSSYRNADNIIKINSNKYKKHDSVMQDNSEDEDSSYDDETGEYKKNVYRKNIINGNVIQLRVTQDEETVMEENTTQNSDIETEGTNSQNVGATNQDGETTNQNGEATNQDGGATNQNGEATDQDGGATNQDGGATSQNNESATKNNNLGTVYRVQVGVYSSFSNAMNSLASFMQMGYSGNIIPYRNYFAVQLGEFDNLDDAAEFEKELRANGNDTLIIRVGK